MTRKSFFAALLTAPLAVFAVWKSKPAPVCGMTVKVTCDASEFSAALSVLSERLAKFDPPLAPDEWREHTDGLPPVILKIDGREIGRVYPFL